jgi:hypothetical protein
MSATVVNPDPFLQFMAYSLNESRGVIGGHWDSNGRFGSGPVSGHMSGLYREIVRRYGNSKLWRSGLVPGTWPSSPGTVGIGMTDAAANGDSWVQATQGSGATQWNTSSGDTFDEEQCPSNINVTNGQQYRYLRWAPGNTPTRYSFTGTNTTQEYRATTGTKWAANGFSGRGHMTFKKISGGGTIRLNVHGHTGSSTLFGFNDAESLNNSGAAELYRRSVDYTVTQANIGVALEPCAREQIFGTPDSTTLSGEIVVYDLCFSDPAATKGLAVDIFGSLGGQSGREGAIYVGGSDNSGSPTLIGNTPTSMINRINAQMALCTDSLANQQMLAIWGFGLNDRNETEPSAGSGVSDGDSPEAYLDNFVTWRDLMEDAWVASGRTLGKLKVLIHVGHPQDPEDAELQSYEDAMADLISSSSSFRNRTTLIRTSQILSGAQMTALGYYDGGGQAHLDADNVAYPGVWRAWMDVLLSSGSGDRNRTRTLSRGR